MARSDGTAPAEANRKPAGSGRRVRCPAPPFTARCGKGGPPDLRDALQELNDSTRDAVDNGLPLPTAVTLKNAEAVLRRLYAIAPASYSVYPSPEGEMTIFDRPKLGHAIALHCAPEGGVLCVIVSPAHSELRTFNSVGDLTDRELRRAVDDMSGNGARG